MKESFLIDVLKKGVSPFHCVEAAMQTLEESGFEELEYARPWNLKKGKAYMMNHHGTTLYAFTVGENFRADAMLRMAAAHTDYPYLRIKPNADFVTDRYAQVNVEVYGGPILNTWFDRPLGIAGRVIVRSKDVFAPETMLYRSGRPVLIIPNLAIHMNREVNKGVAINNQVDLMPVADMLPEEQQSTDYFLSFLAEELAVKKEDILDFELNTYCVEEPAYVGIKETLLSSPRLDNQTSVAALLAAIVEGTRTDGINLIALFDNEEIGNTSKQGAASILLHDMVKRIYGRLAAVRKKRIVRCMQVCCFPWMWRMHCIRIIRRKWILPIIRCLGMDSVSKRHVPSLMRRMQRQSEFCGNSAIRIKSHTRGLSIVPMCVGVVHWDRLHPRCFRFAQWILEFRSYRCILHGN